MPHENWTLSMPFSVFVNLHGYFALISKHIMSKIIKELKNIKIFGQQNLYKIRFAWFIFRTITQFYIFGAETLNKWIFPHKILSYILLSKYCGSVPEAGISFPKADKLILRVN